LDDDVVMKEEEEEEEEGFQCDRCTAAYDSLEMLRSHYVICHELAMSRERNEDWKNRGKTRNYNYFVTNINVVMSFFISSISSGSISCSLRY
jgi:hypothetical protein